MKITEMVEAEPFTISITPETLEYTYRVTYVETPIPYDSSIDELHDILMSKALEITERNFEEHVYLLPKLDEYSVESGDTYEDLIRETLVYTFYIVGNPRSWPSTESALLTNPRHQFLGWSNKERQHHLCMIFENRDNNGSIMSDYEYIRGPIDAPVVEFSFPCVWGMSENERFDYIVRNVPDSTILMFLRQIDNSTYRAHIQLVPNMIPELKQKVTELYQTDNFIDRLLTDSEVPF